MSSGPFCNIQSSTPEYFILDFNLHFKTVLNYKYCFQFLPSNPCVSCGMFFYMVFILPINLQVALSVDRFWAVCFPLSYHINKNSKYKKWIIWLCVLIAVFVGTVPIALKTEYDGINHAFSTWALVSTATIIVLYGFILRSLKNYVSRLQIFKLIKTFISSSEHSSK